MRLLCSFSVLGAIACLLPVVLPVVLPAVAFAHPLVDEGREHMQRAEFDEALAAFERAEQADDLSIQDVMELLSARCLVSLANGAADELQRDLESLAAIDPQFEFGAEAPPELQEAFGAVVEDSGGPISVTAFDRPSPGGIEVTGEAVNDPGLTRELRIFIRMSGGAWRRATDSFVPAAAGETVQYFVELVGPGGAVITQDGSRSEPKSSGAALAGGAAPIGGGGGGGGDFPWLWVGVGAALAAAGAVVAILLLGGGGQDGTRPDPPIVIGF